MDETLFERILTPRAHERLGRLKLYNKEKFKKIKEKLDNSYRKGEIKQVIDEDQFIKLAESIKEEKTGFQVMRKRNFSDLDEI